MSGEGGRWLSSHHFPSSSENPSSAKHINRVQSLSLQKDLSFDKRLLHGLPLRGTLAGHSKQGPIHPGAHVSSVSFSGGGG